MTTSTRFNSEEIQVSVAYFPRVSSAELNLCSLAFLQKAFYEGVCSSCDSIYSLSFSLSLSSTHTHIHIHTHLLNFTLEQLIYLTWARNIFLENGLCFQIQH